MIEKKNSVKIVASNFVLSEFYKDSHVVQNMLSNFANST